MATYIWKGMGWFDENTLTTSNAPAGSPGAPGNGDNILYPAEFGYYSPLSGGSYSNIFVDPYVQVVLGPIPYATATSDAFSAANVFLDPGASLVLEGSPYAPPGTESASITNLFLQRGAWFDPGDSFQPSLGGPVKVDNLFNNGGTLIGTDSLQLGGPGFVQTYGFYPTESEFNDGHGDTVINLGTLIQGSVPFYAIQGGTAMAVSANNATLADVLAAATSGPGGFTWSESANPTGPTVAGIVQGPSVGPGVLINVSTAALGAHSLMLAFNGPGVHDTLVITDRVVAA